MIFLPCELAGAFQIELEPLPDARGFFARAWCRREFADHGLVTDLMQFNLALTRQKGTVRGLHYQAAPFGEAKLVRCTRGAVHDVIVDLRPASSTFRRSMGVELSADNRRMLYVPEGCAHGYQTLIDDAEVCYHTTQYYHPTSARGVRYDDPAFGLRWPLPVSVISDADRSWPDFVG